MVLLWGKSASPAKRVVHCLAHVTTGELRRETRCETRRSKNGGIRNEMDRLMEIAKRVMLKSEELQQFVLQQQALERQRDRD